MSEKQLAAASGIKYEVVLAAVANKQMRCYRAKENSRPTIAGQWFMDWYNTHYK